MVLLLLRSHIISIEWAKEQERGAHRFCLATPEGSGVESWHVTLSLEYHLILQTPDANLSQAMHCVNVSYGVWFNKRHLGSGEMKVVERECLSRRYSIRRRTCCSTYDRRLTVTLRATVAV